MKRDQIAESIKRAEAVIAKAKAAVAESEQLDAKVQKLLKGAEK